MATEKTHILKSSAAAATGLGSSSALTTISASSSDQAIDQNDEKELVTIDRSLNLESGLGSGVTGFLDRSIPLSGMSETGFNYVNSIIGSGVIGIPYALHRAGFFTGLMLLIVISILTDYSLIILVKAGNIAGVSTYQDVVEAAFGRPGFYLLTVIQFIYPFIAMISYNVIIGDTVTKALVRIFNISTTRDSWFLNRNTVVFVATLLVTLPLSLQRNMARLNKISLVSLLFVFFIMFFIVWRLIFPDVHIERSPDAYSLVGGGVTEAIGIISFAYMCHHSSFLVYESMENPTQSRWNRITHISLAVSFVIVFVFGVAGYITFTGFSEGDLLENYCTSDNAALLARLLFGVTIMLTYPIECFVVRDVFMNAIASEKHQHVSENKHMITTISIVSAVFALSTLTDCLGIVLTLNGVLAAVPLAYILPAVTYLKLDPGRLFTVEKLPAFLLAGVGVIVAVSGTFLAVVDVVRGISCSHGREHSYCNALSGHTDLMKDLNFNLTSEHLASGF